MDALNAERFPLTGRMLPQMRNRAFVLRCRNGSEAPFDGGFNHLLESLIAGLEAGLAREPAAAQ